MEKLKMISLIAATLPFAFSTFAQGEQISEQKTAFEPLPRDLEIQLALSALPAHLREQATVYVLNPAKGFEVARKGTNGFHAFVARTGDDAMRGSWSLEEYPKDVLYPVSFDAAGAKANMRVFFDIAALQANGTPPAELKRTIQKRYTTGHYKAPERAGLSYMLSPVVRTYANPDESNRLETTNNPHVMHYGPNISKEDIGGVEPGMSPYPFVTQSGPHGFIVQHLDRKEAAAITNGYQGMLARVCKMKRVWCLPAPTHSH